MKNSPLWFTGQVPANHRGLLTFMKDWSRSGGEFDSPYWEKRAFCISGFVILKKRSRIFDFQTFWAIFSWFLHRVYEKTALSCGIFAVHLFYQRILVPVAGVEPARHRWQWILSPPCLPIPTHRQVWKILYTILVCLASIIFRISKHCWFTIEVRKPGVSKIKILWYNGELWEREQKRHGKSARNAEK